MYDASREVSPCLFFSTVSTIQTLRKKMIVRSFVSWKCRLQGESPRAFSHRSQPRAGVLGHSDHWRQRQTRKPGINSSTRKMSWLGNASSGHVHVAFGSSIPTLGPFNTCFATAITYERLLVVLDERQRKPRNMQCLVGHMSTRSIK